VPTTSLFSQSIECVEISNQKNVTKLPKKFERIRSRTQAGRPTPGRPAYKFCQNDRGKFYGEPEAKPAWLKTGPSGLATSAGWPASLRPAGPTYRPNTEHLCVMTVCNLPSPFLSGFRSNSFWINSSKMLNGKPRKRWNLFMSFSSC